MRRRILRIDVASGGFGSASGTASAVLHGRPGEVQAALYTSAKPISGHYCEFPDETSNLYLYLYSVRSIDPRELNSFPVFRRVVSHEQGCSRVKFIRHKEKKILSRQHHRRMCEGIFRRPKLSISRHGYFNPRRNNISAG